MSLNDSHTHLVFGLAVAIALQGCDRPPPTPPSRSSDSKVGTFPTTAISANIFSAAPVYRQQRLKMLLNQSHEACGTALAAEFKGTFEGTDLWHVQCDDTGLWELWISADRVTAEQCSGQYGTCGNTLDDDSNSAR